MSSNIFYNLCEYQGKKLIYEGYFKLNVALMQTYKD